MATELKNANNTKIVALLTASILVCAGFQYGFDALPSWQEALITGAGSTVFSAMLVLLTNLLPHGIKHKLVFTRFVNEMPGGRVHRLCRKDSRLLYSEIQTKWPDVFDEEISQQDRNAHWYQQIYKTVKDTNEVRQSHSSFLLYRDTLSGLVSLILIIALWEIFGDPQLFGEVAPSVYYILAASAALSLISARNAGNRFVVNAVATAL